MSFRRTYRPVLILISAVIIATACTEPIDIELDSTYQRLVVEGYVNTDSIKHYVILSVTSDYFFNEASPRLSDAFVELSFEGESMQLIENDAVPGLYEAPYAFRGVIGSTYDLDISQLDINQDGVEDRYYASSTMPGGTELEYIELKYYPTAVATGYAVFMYAFHPPEQRDWFGFKLFKNGVPLSNSLEDYSVLSDDIFDDGYLPGLPVGFLSDDETEQAVHPGDTVTFELNCIDEAYYNFVSGAQLEIVGYNPLFSGPSANVASNLSDGAFGIFAAYSIQRTFVVAD
ncbi:MAG: DUF4249 family protein [Bacteroidota bacterium]|nr:DUF4249 family protein [Bacteroidota bacterium]